MPPLKSFDNVAFDFMRDKHMMAHTVTNVPKVERRRASFKRKSTGDVLACTELDMSRQNLLKMMKTSCDDEVIDFEKTCDFMSAFGEDAPTDGEVDQVTNDHMKGLEMFLKQDMCDVLSDIIAMQSEQIDDTL
jgi:hypothetical protein